MDGIILKNIVVNKNKVEFNFEVKGELKKYFNTNKLFIDYQQDMSDIPNSILVIPFVATIIPLMWLTNTVMWVTEIDKTFYDAIFKIQAAYQRLYYNYELKGNLIPARFVDNTYTPQRESMLLFSGGIDANTTYVRIENTNPLLFNIQGWYESRDDKNIAADSELQDISRFSEKQNLDFCHAKSNFALLINNDVFNKNIKKILGDSWWHGFQHSMAFISIAIPLAYLLKIQKIYIASSVSLGNYIKCGSYVITDCEFKFADNGYCIHDGSELTRQDKVHILVDYANKTGEDYFIKVCSFNDHNCCACDKCFRTILGIIAEGGDISKFGFYIKGTLKNYFNNLMNEKAQTFNIEHESKMYWSESKKRMIENYENITDKEFVDWFLNYDFEKARKKALFNYYKNNFFKILKRKIFKK